MVAQILAVTIFVAMFVLIVIDKIERQYITLGCGVITLVVVFGLCMHSVTAITDTLNIHSIFTGTFWYTGGAAEESSSGINWATIIFVAGMMVMVEGMARVGFFRWLCMRIAKLVHYKTMAIFMTFIIFQGHSILMVQNCRQLYLKLYRGAVLPMTETVLSVLLHLPMMKICRSVGNSF